jgi:hypothetical protein
MRTLIFMLLPLCFETAAMASDPLFASMSGQWTGTGQRTYLTTQQVTRIDATTGSSVSADSLISENRISETTPQGPRTYTRTYWIRANSAGGYDLGYQGQTQPAGSGTFQQCL